MSVSVEEKVLVIVKNIEYYRVKEGVRMICDYAFSECKKLRNIGLPSSLNFIGRYAFRGCMSLNKIVLPDSLVYIGDGAFYFEDPYKRRDIPFRVTLPPSVVTIEGNPFCNNTIISSHNKRYKVVDNVLYSSDGKCLISYCSPKEEFVVPEGVETIGTGAFRNTPIKRIVFPESLKIIDKEAFRNAEKLEDVKFPNSLKEIRENAFKWCDFKTGCITLPHHIEIIAPDAFDFGWQIKVIKVPRGCLNYYKSVLPKEISNQISEDELIFENGMYFNSNRTELIAVTSGLKNIVIPEGVEIVRDGACTGIQSPDTIKFPSSLKCITIDAFDYDFMDFKALYIPKGSKTYYEEVFEDFKEEIEEY